jgi:uncharacterized protein (TIGR03086 family)
MSESAERYRKVAAAFTERVLAVPDDAWDLPAPCDGWVARDVVGHLTSWGPSFFVGTYELDGASLGDAADDPVAAWLALDRVFQGALDDPEVATRVRSLPMGDMTFAETMDMIYTPDVLIHTWDLARATGLDERLDPVEVHRMADGIEAMDAVMRSSGHYGPRVDVADDADEQTWLLGFLGRHP